VLQVKFFAGILWVWGIISHTKQKFQEGTEAVVNWRVGNRYCTDAVVVRTGASSSDTLRSDVVNKIYGDSFFSDDVICRLTFFAFPHKRNTKAKREQGASKLPHEYRPIFFFQVDKMSALQKWHLLIPSLRDIYPKKNKKRRNTSNQKSKRNASNWHKFVFKSQFRLVSKKNEEKK